MVCYGRDIWSIKLGSLCRSLRAATTNRRLEGDEVEDAAGCTTTRCVLDEWERVWCMALAEIVRLKNRIRMKLE